MQVLAQAPVRGQWARAWGSSDRSVLVQELVLPVWAVPPDRELAVLLGPVGPVVSAVRQWGRLAGQAVERQGSVPAVLVARAVVPVFLGL